MTEDARSKWLAFVESNTPSNVAWLLQQQAADVASLREALKVLATDLRSYIMDQAVFDWRQNISDEVLANPIAAAAVREASNGE